MTDPEDEDREIVRLVRRLRKDVELLLLLNGMAYGIGIALLLANFLTRLFR